jgi:hypothetical protein
MTSVPPGTVPVGGLKVVPNSCWSSGDNDATGEATAEGTALPGVVDAGGGVAGTAVAVPPHAANNMAAVATNPPKRFRI